MLVFPTPASPTTRTLVAGEVSATVAMDTTVILFANDLEDRNTNTSSWFTNQSGMVVKIIVITYESVPVEHGFALACDTRTTMPIKP